MAKIVGKGGKIQQTIATTLTDVAQVLSLEFAGSESLTYDSTTLDGGVFKTYDPTGYSEPGTVSGEMFYDPALVGHQALTDLISSPADESWKLIYSDLSEQAFTGASFGMDVSIVMDDGVKGSFSIQIDGDPAWNT